MPDLSSKIDAAKQKVRLVLIAQLLEGRRWEKRILESALLSRWLLDCRLY